MRNLILVSTNIILQKREESTRNCLPVSVIAILSTGLTSVKEKNTLWNGVNYAVKIENDSLLSKDRKTLQGKIQGDNVVDIVSVFLCIFVLR